MHMTFTANHMHMLKYALYFSVGACTNHCDQSSSFVTLYNRWSIDVLFVLFYAHNDWNIANKLGTE